MLNNIQRQFPVYWWTPADLGGERGDDVERALKEVEGKEGETAGRSSSETYVAGPEGRITIDAYHIVVPDWLPLEEEEREWLEIFRTKLREGQGFEGTTSRESRATQVPESSNDTHNV